MKKASGLVVLISGLAVFMTLILAGSAALAAGKIKVSLRDEKGVVINGKVTAKKDAVTKECDSAAGTCTLAGLSAGKWTVTAKTGGGSTGGPRTITVEDDKTANVTLTMKAPAAIIVEARTTAKTDRSGTKQVAAASTVKNLGAGTVRRVSGTCRDDKGVLINGTVTVMQGSTVMGESKTAAGKYSVFDIAPGSYKFVFKTSGGKTRSRTVTIQADKEAVADFQF